ncbi:anhydro-N-acetylmuramic acid kinase [Chitinophaga sancti]|uniref:Anhydro-N-acetylmuramic acid kinase n=1 Tax=Chitinophaga sancti TaxID=1004 RepID=A0A1K1S9N4_9BACT|nr:anhydro-N-acetylmuramic acid kinase [Chitinophaga sancti]WQD60902.1 anhydro-N-acetylmuramic acid kinase [Chitinophaga sancti]WQG86970.1 anhydro-N-acetylmuramic acid kinase [Chitinophaga sancti]SFW81081.1 anhydro-N-acetylmuramic acid kinase [Chitinophaga sancti]
MVYNVIGVTSGSSLDGLDLVFVALTEVRGKWTYEIKAAERKAYTEDWKEKLSNAANLPARDYFLLHSEYGHYIGNAVKDFIATHGFDHLVHFITTHGHTVFHMPSQKMTAQLGDGAAITAVTGLSVISDLRAMDVALGGKGAPLFPVAEQLLFPNAAYRVNLGENATISARKDEELVAFDVCPCNYVLDALAETLGRAYDENGSLAAGGVTDPQLLDALNGLAYYAQPYPKTLANKFGTTAVLPMMQGHHLSTQSKLNTYTKHIAAQIANAVNLIGGEGGEVLLTGGGAHNSFLVETIKEAGLKVTQPDEQTLTFRTALMIALLGALRWRQETNAFASVTGADRDSVGGALWCN